MDTYGLDFWKAYKAAGFAQVTGRDGRPARISRVTTSNVFVCYAGDSRRYATHPHDIQPANRAAHRQAQAGLVDLSQEWMTVWAHHG